MSEETKENTTAEETINVIQEICVEAEHIPVEISRYTELLQAEIILNLIRRTCQIHKESYGLGDKVKFLLGLESEDDPDA